MAKEKCLGWVPLLRAEGGEEESQVGLVVLEDIRATEAETMILPRTPDETLVVDVATWCLLFVLIRHGFRGGSGPQRWIRALGEETGRERERRGERRAKKAGTWTPGLRDHFGPRFACKITFS